MENNQSGCINRDKNGIYNMLKIVNYYLMYKKRPYKYCRTIKGKNPFKHIKIMGQVLQSDIKSI
jgi:hypothetical protein